MAAESEDVAFKGARDVGDRRPEVSQSLVLEEIATEALNDWGTSWADKEVPGGGKRARACGLELINQAWGSQAEQFGIASVQLTA